MAVICKLDTQHEYLGLDFERFLGYLDTRLRNDDRLLFGSQNERFLGDLDTIPQFSPARKTCENDRQMGNNFNCESDIERVYNGES